MTAQKIDIFPWDDNFNTGLVEVDQQHRRLVELLNLLASHVAFGTELPDIHKVFEQLADYAVYHFATEEAIWHCYLADDAAERDHIVAHQSFVATVQRMQADLQKKPLGDIAEEALGFLARWLASHILENDRHLAYVVQGLQADMSLADAKRHAYELMSGSTRVLISIILSIYGTLSTNTLHLMRELAERKRTEEALRLAQASAEEASKAKSRFLANVSHEFRTPMNGILGMAQLLAMPDVSESERSSYAQTIIESGQQLLGLINRILEVADTGFHASNLESSPFNLTELLRGLADCYRIKAEAKGLALDFRMEESIAVPVTGDSAHLEEMLSALLDNAIKFTDHGDIVIDTRAVSETAGQVKIEIAIADTGIGISSQQKAALFHEFTQVDGSITRRHGGAGLGLALVKRLADAMSAEVGCESTPGEGSRFWVRLSFPKA